MAERKAGPGLGKDHWVFDLSFFQDQFSGDLTMKTTTLFSVSLALAAVLSLATSAVAAPIANLYYDPANGNLKLQNITSGTQAFQGFTVLTLGNGGVGPVSGLPGNVGYMSTGTANLPAGAFNTLNTEAGINGLYSEATASNVTLTPVMTLSPNPSWSVGSPIGPVGSYWDLGNIAVTGMSQADLDSRFVVSGDATGGADAYGQILFFYSTNGAPGFTQGTGNVVAIPEPSTLAIAAVAAGFGGFGAVSRRRKKAAANARSLSINA
jgi:hypothetical protein